MPRKKHEQIEKDYPEAEVATVIEITVAAIKDGKCNYSYIIDDGVNEGDTHQVRGSGVVDDDLLNAFAELNPHFACLDDAFKLKGIEVSDITRMKGDELSTNYQCTAIKVSGSAEDLKVVLIGNKAISKAAGRMDITTPKIPLNGSSSYPFAGELGAAVAKIQEEVELYRNGKFTKEEDDDDMDHSKQLNVFANQEEGEE